MARHAASQQLDYANGNGMYVTCRPATGGVWLLFLKNKWKSLKVDEIFTENSQNAAQAASEEGAYKIDIRTLKFQKRVHD